MKIVKILFFVFILLISKILSQPTSKIYYSQYSESQRNVFQSELDGTNEVSFLLTLRPSAFAIDWKSNPQKLYIGLLPTSIPGKIIRCDIDGNNQEDVLTDLIGIDDIELDLISRKIYVAQDTYDNDKIIKADMDGLNSSIQQIYSSTIASRDLWGIALDVNSYRIWFTERGGTCYSSYIKRMSMDGNGLTTIVNPVCNPHDIEYFDGKIFWGDGDGLEIANPDGSGITTIVSPAKVDGLAIDATNHRIYWVDYIYGNVRRVDFDGSNETTISNTHSLLSKIDTDYNPAITNVETTDHTISNYGLHQNYPNPFNPSTKISWQSPAGGWLTLKVYDVLGNEVATLIDEYKPAGIYSVQCTMNELASGVYMYQLKTGDFIKTKKMIYLK